MAILGKIRNRLTKEEKDEIDKNASIAAQESITYDKPTKQYTKRYTQKEWNRFGVHQQQVLTNRYHVIITDHETKKEKWKRRAKQVNLKNFDKGMSKFDNAQKQFWSEFDKGFKDAGMKSKGSVFGSPSKSNHTSTIFGSSKKVKSNKFRI